jgi:hypothetical protein
MELGSKRKILLLTLTACIAFAIFFSETLAAAELDHDCIGEEHGCLICLQIEAINNFLKTLKIAGIIVFFAGYLVFSAQTFQRHMGFITYLYSPVALKIRLNT